MTFFFTHSRKKLDLANIKEEDICLEDIAHHLSKICRYGGALGLFKHYSVARHSLYMYDWAKKKGWPKDILAAILFHDASEAFLGDVVSGLKKYLADYLIIEDKIQNIIYKKYDIKKVHITYLVKTLDTRIVLDEANAFMLDVYIHFHKQLKGIFPLGIKIKPDKISIVKIILSKVFPWINFSNHTKKLFLKRCKELGIKD